MIFRLLLLVISTGMHLHFYDAFYTKNFNDGMYSADSDSIGIPIFTSAIIVVGAAIGSSPFILLGSKYVRRKLASARLYVAIPACLIFLFCYLLILGIAVFGASSIFDPRYQTISIDAIWLFIIPFVFLLIDAYRFFYHIKSNFYLSRKSNL